MIYRIYTEDVNREGIESLLQEYFKGYTLIPTVGYWEGSKEAGLVIEIINGVDIFEVYKIAREIKRLNRQKEVLLTIQEIQTVLI